MPRTQGNVVGYWVEGTCLCSDCAEEDDQQFGDPIYLVEATDDDLECDLCGCYLEDLGIW